tara:strand:- start:1258 stop:1578 length:321 start_codon:yes stop_codon:yes gene_type:complete
LPFDARSDSVSALEIEKMALRAEVAAPRPDRSTAAVAQRRSIVDQSRASNVRQGYVHDAELEAINEAYVVGDLTSEECSAAIDALIADQIAAFKAADAAEAKAERR